MCLQNRQWQPHVETIILCIGWAHKIFLSLTSERVELRLILIKVKIMSSRKFFSGLPPAMMSRQSGPNRQQSHFFWPDESIANQVPSRSRMRNRSLSTASVISQSQASTDTEESRKRRSNDMRSRIEFYDMVDTTDTESVYNRKLDPTTHKKLEGLKSRIEFYDYADSSQGARYMENDDAISVIEVAKKNEVKEVPKSEVIDHEIAKSMNSLSLQNHKKPPPAPQRIPIQKQSYPDSFDSESEDEMHRHQKSFRNHELPSQRYIRRPPIPQQQRPRRYHSHIFDDFEDDGYERYYDSNRRPRLPRMSRSRRDYSPDDISDEDFYDDRSYSRRNIPNVREYRNRGGTSRYGDYSENFNNRAISNGHANEIETASRHRTPPRQQQPMENESDTRPPVKPVERTISLNEARRRHHVNLKSNIFHNDNEYEQVVGQRKPLSVRDFAANHRVGVGLPDLV